MYDLNGTERKETETQDVGCGTAYITKYFDATTGELVRQDTHIVVTDGLAVEAMSKQLGE